MNKKQVNPYCGTKFVSAAHDVDGATQYTAFPLLCKSWDCPHCAKKKGKKIKKIIKANFDKSAVMLTLTYQQAGRDKLAVWQSLGKSWNNLLTYIKKKLKIKLKFVRVVEAHKSGFPHLHVIIDRFIPTNEALRTLMRYGFGYQMRQQKMSTQNAANYVAKYLTKFEWSDQAKMYRSMTKTRVVSMSRSLQMPVKIDKSKKLLCVNKTAAECDLSLQQFTIDQLSKGLYMVACFSKNDALTIRFKQFYTDEYFDINALTQGQRTNISIAVHKYLTFYPQAENALLLQKQLEFYNKTVAAKIGFASDRRNFTQLPDHIRSKVGVGTKGIT